MCIARMKNMFTFNMGFTQILLLRDFTNELKFSHVVTVILYKTTNHEATYVN